MATPLGRSGYITLGAATLLAGLFLGGGHLALRVMDDARVQRLAVTRSQHVVEMLLDLRGMLFEAVAARNQVLFGDPGPFRLVFRRTQERLDTGLARLQEEVKNVPEQAATAQALRERTGVMMARLEQTLRFSGADRGVDVLMLIREIGAERQALLQLADRITAWERDHLAQFTRAHSRRAEQARMIMAGLFGVSLLLGIGALWLLHHYRQGINNRYAVLEASQRATVAANASLSASRGRLQSILDHARDPILLLDGADRIQLANDAAAEQFGQNLAALLGQPVQALIPTFGRRQGEVQARRADGSSFPVELSVGRYEQEGEVGSVCVLRDVTERRRLDEMKNEFISTVSHELRTPLTSIRASLGLVTGGVAGAVPAQARELLDIAHKNSERLVLLVNDILDIEKMEAGRLEFRRERVLARDLLEQAVATNRAYGEQFGVRFAFTPPAEDAAVYADVQRIQQVLANLLSNAAKFSPAGGTVEVVLVVDAGNATFRIRDHGAGIPPEFRRRIFQRFAQADSSDVRQKGGTGLGLSISRAIVEHHGGQIGFEDAPGGGTCFFFSLPRLVERAALPPAEPGRRRRALIIEDDADVAQLLHMLLDQHGWSGRIARNATEAFAALDEEAFDALTLDLMLPDEDGISLFRRLRQRPDGSVLPVVVISATADDGRRTLNGDAVGVVDWLDKPIDQGRLRAALLQALRTSEGPAEILHVEDDDDIRRVLAAVMGDEARMAPARSLAEARAALAGDTRFALVVIDLGLPDGNGLDLLPDIRALQPPPPVLIFSASDTDAQTASSVAAALVKSRTENNTLHDTIRHLIEAQPATTDGVA
ncbi:ATP-binding response regulator [Teichococcus vastitatis]|uniref:histidine kinase n=1 Tax=Teichococcus vastitatis TaxID=2307076 RepID=A0ABS9W0A2_9PROT|nr:response regulator [Pseudoroseomonas vastitatis]MCI0752280.1 response regulator [Pseudoroseomonas vastitatis]